MTSTRSWTLRTRTALAFAVTSMALTAGVLVFVNVASISSISSAVRLQPDPHAVVQDDQDAGPDRGTGPSPVGPRRTIVAVVAEQQWQWSAVGVLGAGVLAGGLGWWLSRRMLRPIDRITEATNRISASTLHERIALAGPDDELRRLSRTVDSLLDRLEAAFDGQRRFVAHASHELRTPLAVQRAAIQIGLDDDADAATVRATRAQLLDQNRRSGHLVESLLLLAEAERDLGGRTCALDLDAIAADVVAQAAPAAASAGVTVHRSGPTGRSRAAPPGRGAVRGPAPAGEPVLVRQLLSNLVGNAVAYNEPGGQVHVGVDEHGITVENSGPCVPLEVVPDLTRPFTRHGAPGVGCHSGLGLSIVDAVVAAHGWTLRIVPRDGGGLRVHVGVSSM